MNTEVTPWYRRDPKTGGWLLDIYVQPDARTSSVSGLHDNHLKIRLAAPALDDKANACLLAFLAKQFAVTLKQVSLKRGNRSRRKCVAVTGTECNPETLLETSPSLKLKLL